MENNKIQLLQDPQLQVKDQIVQNALKHAAFDGWSMTTIERAFQDAQVDFEFSTDYFPLGLEDVLLHYGDYIDRLMIERTQEAINKSQEEDPQNRIKVQDKIKMAIKIRLEILAPYRESIRRTVSFLAMPLQLSTGLKILYHTVDQIWYLAGDTSTDFNYYSKRGLLAGVYTSTLLCWLSDKSAHYQDTNEFLERRIKNVLSIGKTIHTMKEFCKNTNIFVFPGVNKTNPNFK